MENNYGGFGTQDILTGRGLGLYGFGGYGGLTPGNSSLAALAHADGTAVKTAIDCNASANIASLDRISDQNEETRRVLQNDRLSGIITDGQLQNAILNGQRDVATADRFAKQAADAAECCCETQKLILSEANETRNLINARALEETQRELDRERANANTERIIAAILASNGRPGQGNSVAKTAL